MVKRQSKKSKKAKRKNEISKRKIEQKRMADDC